MKFQEMILALQSFWSERGCVLAEPYDVEKGAGTMNPSTFLRVLGPEPWNAAYVEPSRRPADGRDENTVLFHGELPADISEITEVAHNLIAYLDYMEWIENRRWNMVTKGGITILLPEENPSAAISSLLVLEKNHNILSKDIRVIDMRDDARILVK